MKLTPHPMKLTPSKLKYGFGLIALVLGCQMASGMSVYWSEGVYILGKTGDSDQDFIVYGGTGASSSPSGPGVGITVRGTLTTSLYPPSIFSYPVEVSAQPVWTPYPGAGNDRGETTHVDVWINGPQSATFTNTVEVVSVTGPTYPGTTSHTVTVTVIP